MYNATKEYDLGEIFEIDGKYYKFVKVSENHMCKGCAFEYGGDCSDIDCWGRKDENNTIVVEVDKPLEKGPVLQDNLSKEERVKILEQELEILKKELGKTEEHTEEQSQKSYAQQVLDHVWKELLEYFEWDKVVTMMNSIGWTWNPKKPLTKEDLQQHAYNLVDLIIHDNIEDGKDIQYTESGGFRVCYRSGSEAAELEGFEPERGKWPSIELFFIGDSWMTSPLADNDPAMQGDED